MKGWHSLTQLKEVIWLRHYWLGRLDELQRKSDGRLKWTRCHSNWSLMGFYITNTIFSYYLVCNIKGPDQNEFYPVAKQFLVEFLDQSCEIRRVSLLTCIINLGTGQLNCFRGSGAMKWESNIKQLLCV